MKSLNDDGSPKSQNSPKTWKPADSFISNLDDLLQVENLVGSVDSHSLLFFSLIVIYDPSNRSLLDPSRDSSLQAQSYFEGDQSRASYISVSLRPRLMGR
jgi:hypothetical protein